MVFNIYIYIIPHLYIIWFLLSRRAETGDKGADDCEVSTIPTQSGLDGVKKTIISTTSYSSTVPR